MKYPCELIKDILPLFYDNVCSDTTSEVVKQHLEVCTDCKKLYQSLLNSDAILLNSEQSLASEDVAVIKGIKRKLLKKKIITVLITLLASFVFLFGTAFCLTKIITPISYENISISVEDDILYFKSLQPLALHESKCKVIQTGLNGNIENIMFFSFNTSVWQSMFSESGKTYSASQPFLTINQDFEIDNIDKVYYFVGDYEQLENIQDSELAAVISDSQLLWSK